MPQEPDEPFTVDGLTMAELDERLDLLGPDFVGTFESFEALIKSTEHLLLKTMPFDRRCRGETARCD